MTHLFQQFQYQVKGRRGFTLVELLVVIAVIAIMLAVAAPSFLGQQEKAHDSATTQYLTTAYKAAKTDSVFDAGRYQTGRALADMITASEPQLRLSVLDSGARLPSAQGALGVCESSSAYELRLVGRSQSGNGLVLIASDNGLHVGPGDCDTESPHGAPIAEVPPADDDEEPGPGRGTGDEAGECTTVECHDRDAVRILGELHTAYLQCMEYLNVQDYTCGVYLASGWMPVGPESRYVVPSGWGVESYVELPFEPRSIGWLWGALGYDINAYGVSVRSASGNAFLVVRYSPYLPLVYRCVAVVETPVCGVDGRFTLA